MHLIRYFSISVKEISRLEQSVKIAYSIKQGLSVPITHDTGS